MILYIKVKPNAKQDLIKQEAYGSYKVYIKAPPVDGKANEYLVKFIADILGLPKSKVAILKGETCQIKKLEIDATDELIQSRIADTLLKN